jgi:hypothetical protein
MAAARRAAKPHPTALPLVLVLLLLAISVVV